MNTTNKERATERLNFRFTPETLRKLKEIAAWGDLNMTQAVELALDELYERAQKKAQK